jgi:hypothetical protein
MAKNRQLILNYHSMKIPIQIKKFAGLTAMVLLVIMPVLLLAQENRGESKAAKKEREKTEQGQRFRQARQLILDTSFVVPAETVQFKDGGMMTPVQNTINFLKMDGDEAVLQIGSDFARSAGLNSLGGITLKGKIQNLKIKDKEDKNRLYLRFTLSGLIGTAQISLSLTGSEKAMIDVDGMFSGRAFSIRGPVQTIKGTNIFEGTEF